MRRKMARSFCLMMAAALVACGAAALAGQFSVAGVQSTSGPVGGTRNTTGYQLRMGVMPLKCGMAQSAAKNYTIHIGLFDEVNPARNAARLWAFYE